MTKDEALDVALEALRSVAGELYRVTSYCDTYDALAETNNAIMDIQQARLAPVQEPVAFFDWYDNAHWGNEDFKEGCHRAWNAAIKYTTPPAAQPAPVQPPTIEDNSQDWAGMDGATAWHLINRHADGWADVAKMMGEWLAANTPPAQPAPVQPIIGSYLEKDNSQFKFSDYESDGVHHNKLAVPVAQRPWVGLTDEEMNEAMDYWSEDSRSAYGGAHAADGEYVSMISTWRYIEAKLKEKNT